MTDYRNSEVFSNDYVSESKEKSSPIPNYFNSAGYMPVNSDYVEKLQFTGRKTFAFWTLVTILSILAIGNLCLTFVILNVLRLGTTMESMEFIHDQDAIKFFGNADLGHVYKRNGKIEGFKDLPVELTAQYSAIIFNLSPKFGRVHTNFRMNENVTLFDGINKFEIRDENDKVVYSSRDPFFNSIKSANNLQTKVTLTNRISSPLKNDLTIEGKTVHLKGAEGTTINGKLILWSADQDLNFKTDNGSIVMTSQKDIFINLKNAPAGVVKRNNLLKTQYKICVCMPQGKLFRIPVAGANSVVSCHHVNMSPQHNPCY